MDLINEAILTEYMAERPSHIPQLFHYTRADGLRGILEEKKLWLTNAAYVNDEQELTYPVLIARAVVRSFLERESKDRRRELLAAIDASLESHSLYKVWYIGSFTKEGNSLSQWRAYCSTGGYSIGFEGQSLFQDLPARTSYLYGAVIYDQDEQVRRVEAVLNRYFDVWERIRDKHNQVQNDQYDNEVAFQLSYWLSRELIFFKSPAFITENEWRIAKRPRAEQLLFRNRAGLLTPYLNVSLCEPTAKLPLTQIAVSPLGDIELASHAVQVLLNELEYENVKILTPRFRLRF